MFLQKNRKILEIRDCSSLPLNLFGNIEQICIITINSNPSVLALSCFRTGYGSGDRTGELPQAPRQHCRDAARGPGTSRCRSSAPLAAPCPSPDARPAPGRLPATARRDSDQPWEAELLGKRSGFSSPQHNLVSTFWS